jgi:RNA exonuclease 4
MPVSKGVMENTRNFYALDCEMIGGPGNQSMVAEVAIVDYDGNVVYHTYVRPTVDSPAIDYRTQVSGITAEKLVGAPSLNQVQRDVYRILQGKTLIGHALANDLKALGFYATGLDLKEIRNTAQHAAFQWLGPRRGLQPQKLSNLFEKYVEQGPGNADFQKGAHSAVEDARASMRVYRTHHERWKEPVVHEGPVWDPTRPPPRSTGATKPRNPFVRPVPTAQPVQPVRQQGQKPKLFTNLNFPALPTLPTKKH